MSRTVVAVIPGGVTFGTCLATLDAMGKCYPPDTLALSSDTTAGGMLVVHDPAARPPSDDTPAPTLTVELGVEHSGDLLAYAFTAEGDEEVSVHRMCVAMIAMLEEQHAANFLAMTMEHPKLGRYGITVQRCAGKTPAEMIGELTDEVQRLTEAAAGADASGDAR